MQYTIQLCKMRDGLYLISRTDYSLTNVLFTKLTTAKIGIIILHCVDIFTREQVSLKSTCDNWVT